ncbi:MAG: hypothetical protein GY765_18595, partial [bacterium]|nr:hypothetical protein [bacterium]
MRKNYRCLGNGKCRTGLLMLLTVSCFLWTGIFYPLYGNYDGNYGNRYHTNYTQYDYSSHPQNWFVTQTPDGFLYVANLIGVLEYDGAAWNTIAVPNGAALSLGVDKQGVLYVGGRNELGFLSASSNGKMEYSSLRGLIDKKSIGLVWRTHVFQDRVFFRTSKYIIQWNPLKGKMSILLETAGPPGPRFNASFVCKDKLFVKQSGQGLLQKTGDSFELIPGGEIFADIKTLFLMVPYMETPSHRHGEDSHRIGINSADTVDKRILIGTREKGFFVFDGRKLEPFSCGVADYLKETRANVGITLSNGDIAIGTLGGGVVITDHNLKLKYLFNRDTGLADNEVKNIYEDSRGNIWAALNNGISKLEYTSSLSLFDNRNGLPGSVYAVTGNVAGLYAGSNLGLFLQSPGSPDFRPVPGIRGACWHLQAMEDHVLAATSNGVFKVQNHMALQITKSTSYCLFHSIKNPDRIWVGGDTLCSLDRSTAGGDNDWKQERVYNNVKGEIRTIAEDPAGNLWIGTRNDVLQVVFMKNDYEVITYDTSHQLPKGEIQVFRAAGHIMFGAKSRLLRFDREKNIFVPDVTLGKDFSMKLQHVYRLAEDESKTIRLHDKGRNYLAVPTADNGYTIGGTSLKRIPLGAQVNCFFADTRQNITWLASIEGLIRYDEKMERESLLPHTPVIRKISINGAPKYYNYRNTREKETGELPWPVFSYNQKDIRFEFSAPFFRAESRTKYRFFLEGYEDKWSPWTSETRKDYTNIDAGKKVFHIQARDIYGNISPETLFKFKVLPPWYGSWWAFLLYVLIVSSAVFFIVKWRLGKHKKEKLHLEELIRERTKEIKLKNGQLENQKLQLQKQAEDLKELDKAKSRFFANISHEFRTPLTLIMGPLERLSSFRLSEDVRESLDMMHRNSQRLLMLINRLLELSRLDSGKMKLKTRAGDVVSFVRGIWASFRHIGNEKKQTVEFRVPESRHEGDSISLFYDEE